MQACSVGEDTRTPSAVHGRSRRPLARESLALPLLDVPDHAPVSTGYIFPPSYAGRVASQRRLRFVRVQIAGMLVSVLALALLDALSLDAFFICSLLVLLVATELTDPLATTPNWRTRVRWAILIGLVVFGYVIAQQV
jgi:hypothetical protein